MIRGRCQVVCLAVRITNLNAGEDLWRHTKMGELVERMLELHERLAKVKTPQSRERLQWQIAAPDWTDEEIAIVEAAAEQ